MTATTGARGEVCEGMMFDSCIGTEYDFEGFSRRWMRVARKRHKCGECPAIIKPGEEYEVAEGHNGYNFWQHKTCASCARMRDSMFHGWVYGDVWHDFEYTYGFSPFEVPESA